MEELNITLQGERLVGLQATAYLVPSHGFTKPRRYLEQLVSQDMSNVDLDWENFSYVRGWDMDGRKLS
jgi:hypothetical protein